MRRQAGAKAAGLTRVDGVWHLSHELASEMTGLSKQSLTKARGQDHPPPYNEIDKLYPFKALAHWMKEHQIYRAGKGGVQKTPDLSRFNEKALEDIERQLEELRPKTQKLMPGVKPSTPAPPREDQETRYKRIRADKLQIEVSAMAGDYVLADEVLLKMVSAVSVARSRLLGLPSQLALDLSTMNDVTEVEEYLRRQIKVALNALSRSKVEDAITNDDDEDEDEDF
jgi:hypothetical protein